MDVTCMKEVPVWQKLLCCKYGCTIITCTCLYGHFLKYSLVIEEKLQTGIAANRYIYRDILKKRNSEGFLVKTDNLKIQKCLYLQP